jgi:hypothetical protein
MLFTRPMIIHLRDLVICCAALMYSYRVGPEYYIRHADEQIPLLVYTPQPTPLENPRDTFFNHPVTVRRLMQLEFPPKIVIKYNLMV